MAGGLIGGAILGAISTTEEVTKEKKLLASLRVPETATQGGPCFQIIQKTGHFFPSGYYLLYEYVREKGERISGNSISHLNKLLTDANKSAAKENPYGYNYAFGEACKYALYKKGLNEYGYMKMYDQTPPLCRYKFAITAVSAATAKVENGKEGISFCRFCGTQIIDTNTRFCRICGKELGVSNASIVNNKTTTINRSPYNDGPKVNVTPKNISSIATTNRTVSDGNVLVNELRQYRQLVQEGLITENDYEIKKKQLLGL